MYVVYLIDIWKAVSNLFLMFAIKQVYRICKKYVNINGSEAKILQGFNCEFGMICSRIAKGHDSRFRGVKKNRNYTKHIKMINNKHP